MTAVQTPNEPAPARIIGRYALFGEIASGGMATVHFGRLLGPVGFARTVAIKRLHGHLAKDPEFAEMFLDEARLAARIQHPNVVSTLDVVAMDGEMFLVMEYVDGESLSRLLRKARSRGELVDTRIAVTLVANVLHGLHSAHEAKNERGEPLEIVHRDVSPQNVLVGRDGSVRVLDFGVAKAVGKLHSTREGSLKGKLAYMPPEQIRRQELDRRADIYSASVMLWEILTGQRLFRADNEAAVLDLVLNAEVPAPSSLVPGLPFALDGIVLAGLSRDRARRYSTAHEMALALEAAVPPALATTVSAWVRSIGSEALDKRAAVVADIESSSEISTLVAPPERSELGTQPEATPPPYLAPASSRRPVVALALVVLLLIVAVLTLGALLLLKRPAPIVAVDPPPPVTLTVTVTAPATAPATDRVVAPAASSASSAVSTASAASAAPKPSAAGVVGHSTPAASVKPAGTAGGPDCRVPYTVDANGTVIYKRECL